MTITPQIIEAYITILKDPVQHGLNMKPFKDYYQESENFEPQDILAKHLIAINPAIPKIVIYLLFEEFFGPARSTGGSAGYYLSFCN